MKTIKNIILIEFDLPYCRILARYKSIFEFRNGILSAIERIKQEHSDKEILYFHPEIKLEKIFCNKNNWKSFCDVYPEIASELKTKKNLKDSLNYIKDLFEDSLICSSLEFDLIHILDKVEENILADLKKLKREEYNNSHKYAQIHGNNTDIWIHPSVDITYGVVLDARNGPIIIDKNCKISAFTYIEGPFYAAENCYIDNVRITGGVILGKYCRVGGEIENSIFGNFTNKHHEGFVGHSLIGDWVNLGALTTTSDLKNNYGEVRISVPEARIPEFTDTPIIINTNRIKFGSIIGDCVKTSIGTMLNTGSVIDIGCNVFGGSPPPYLPPFSWGIRGHKYDLDRFLKDCEKIFARRNQIVDSFFIELTKLYYSRLV
ncbi:MAG: glucose-1-phosphate thymidylyltransferase [Leptospiraceae bacterium]|nr:MAG: glucose-1-phosphate thymidylyltransferase [Leptospiraceae bacterium]